VSDECSRPPVSPYKYIIRLAGVLAGSLPLLQVSRCARISESKLTSLASTHLARLKSRVKVIRYPVVFVTLESTRVSMESSEAIQ
jgi:hypothetical protein